jgi:hypothetical protein
MGGLVMEKFDLLMKGGAHGPVIIPGKSAESRSGATYRYCG